MSVDVIEISREQLLQRREALLGSIPISAETLQRRIDEDNASEEERVIDWELQEIAFLLGDDA